jgi:hypothetical protein
MYNYSPILVNPKPDFSGLESVLKGEGKSDKVYQIELAIDEEILEAISERYLNTKWMHRINDNFESYYNQLINIYYKLGYDALLDGVWRETWLGHPPLGSPKTKDTVVELSRGEREWAIEGIGLIDSWKDLEFMRTTACCAPAILVHQLNIYLYCQECVRQTFLYD